MSGPPDARCSQRQRRGSDEPFVVGLGKAPLSRGMPNGPARETIQCRCVVTVRYAHELDEKGRCCGQKPIHYKIPCPHRSSARDAAGNLTPKPDTR